MTRIRPDSRQGAATNGSLGGKQRISKPFAGISTGIRAVRHDAENRPVLFTCTEADGSETQIACAYDSMGRRATKEITVNGGVTLRQRYIYRGYLQIDSQTPHRLLAPSGQTRFAVCPPGLAAVGRVACCDLARSAHPCLWLVTWDLTQPVAPPSPSRKTARGTATAGISRKTS